VLSPVNCLTGSSNHHRGSGRWV